MGSFIGILVLTALLPVVRQIILAFSFPEFTMLAVMGLAAIAAASTGSLIKGLISGGVGLLLSFVGFSPVAGELRYVFGITQLFQGVDLIATLIGLFAITEVIRLLIRRETVAQDIEALKFSKDQVWEGVRFVFKNPSLLIRSAILGTGVGIVPGVGGTVASFLAYFQAVHTSSDPESFGKGDPRGVLAPEAANDGKDAGSALPSLAFGLPGSSDWRNHSGRGGAARDQPRPKPDPRRRPRSCGWPSGSSSSPVGRHRSWACGRPRSWRKSQDSGQPARTDRRGSGTRRRLLPSATVRRCGVRSDLRRTWVLHAAVSHPVVPLILGLLLGEATERAFFQSIQVFDQGLGIFVTRPISLILVLITIFIFVAPLVTMRRGLGSSKGLTHENAARRAQRHSCVSGSFGRSCGRVARRSSCRKHATSPYTPGSSPPSSFWCTSV